MLPRPHVEQRLRDAVAHATLTMVRAPIGAGKTSLALGTFGGQHLAWMNAQPWNHDAFVRELVESIRQVREGFGRLTLGTLETEAAAAHVGQTFAGELEHIDEPLLVVIDNAQVFAGDRAFVDFMNEVVERVSGNVRFLLLGRSLPALALGRAIARGRIAIFDENFLALGNEEIATFARACGRELKPSELEEIRERTNGWAAGVILTLSSPDRLAPQAFLEEHLIPELGERNVELLERISVFEQLDADVLSNLPGLADAAQRLHALREAGVPIDVVTQTRYRMHPLLRDLLCSRLEGKGGEREAHVAAARAYMQTGNVGAAIYHAELASDAAFTYEFLREHLEAVAGTGRYRSIRSLAARMSDNAGPVALLARGYLEKGEGNPASRESFARAAAAAEKASEVAMTFHARAQVIEHDLGHLASVDSEAIESLAALAEGMGVAERVRVELTRGWAAAVAHDFRATLARVEPLRGIGDETARFNSGILRAYAETALGEIETAQRTLDEVTHLLEGSDRVVLQALTLVWFARLALVWGNVDAAADAASQAERLFAALELRAEEAALFGALAEIATHAGDVANVVRYAERARARASHAWYAADQSRIAALAETALARAAFLGHDNAIACDLAVRAAKSDWVPSAQRAQLLAEASVYALLTDPAQAEAAIERAREAIVAAVPIDAADAVAIATAGDIIAFLDAANGRAHETALANLAKFATLLERRRGLVTLEHAGIAVGNARRGTTGSDAAFTTALELLTRDGPRFEARLARAYASAFIKTNKPAVAAAPKFDFTAREQEILTLLSEGLSNKEIAQRLVVSPRTIETHVERVLGKLEVGSRSRAIAKAVRLGLVALD